VTEWLQVRQEDGKAYLGDIMRIVDGWAVRIPMANPASIVFDGSVGVVVMTEGWQVRLETNPHVKVNIGAVKP
jgi:hypothetical protein